MSKEKVNKSRRRFLVLSALGGGGLALGLYLGFGGEKTRSAGELWPKDDGFTPNAWLRIGPDGKVTVRIKHCEMGQGTTTGLSAMVAEELEMPWDRVGFEIAPVEAVYKNPATGVQQTGGSTATPYSWDPLRKAGAAAREILIAAAAAQWKVPKSKCRAREGRVIHAPTGRSLDYGKLAEAASKMEIPKDPPLKKPADYKLVGKPLGRLDTRAKITGRAVYGQDMKLPGMVVAHMIHPPVIGAALESFDPAKALKMPGVVAVVPLSSGLAVAAESFWQASQAAEVVEARWSGGLKDLSSESFWDRWRRMARSGEAKELHQAGEPEKALARAAKVMEAEYLVPWQAHATPEPMNCTAQVEPGRCRIWAPTQNQDACQEVGARICGLGYDRVEVTTTYVGGGFGRRTVPDYAAEAVELSKKLKRPVKVMWTREEDMANGFYRPASLHLVRAGLDAQGALTAWSHRIVGPSDLAGQIPYLFPSIVPYWVPRGIRNISHWASREFLPGMVAVQGVNSGVDPPDYGIPDYRADYIHDNPGIPCGFWRGVAHVVNAFVVECFMDELAQAAGRDPLAWRLPLLKANPGLARVLKMAAQGGEGERTPEGIFSGLAGHTFHGAPAAMRAQVAVEGGRVVVKKVVAAVDCGRVINPRQARHQVEGGIAFALSATLNSEITFD